MRGGRTVGWIRCGVALAAWVGGGLEPALGQTRDTLRTDTLMFRIGEVRVQAQRAATTVGGASALEVTLDSLSLSAAPTVEEVLRQLPGIHLRTNSRGEAEISVRGSESRQVAVLVDGVPITLGWDARTDVSVLPAAAPHQITLIRGLSSILHGPNVLGGVVEMSVARGFAFPARPSGQVTAGYDGVGGYGASASASMPRETSGGRWLVRAGAGFRDSPGTPLPGGVTEPVPTRDGLRLNSDARSVDGFLALRHGWDSGGWFTFSASSFAAERGVAAELDAENPRLWRYPSVRRTIAVVSAGSGDRATPLGRGDVEASVGVDAGRTEIESYATRAYERVTGTEAGDARTVTVRLLSDHTLGPRGELRAAFTWADVTQDVTLDGVPTAYRQRLSSVGAESVWRLHESAAGPVRAVRLSVGGALDRGDTPLTGGRPSLGAISDWGARTGMTVLLGDGRTLLHAGASRRGRFPALREIYSEALDRFEPNPALRPERLAALEGGVTTRVWQGEVQVVGFLQELDGAIRRVPLPNRKWQRVNAETLESRGLEFIFSQVLGGVKLGADLMLQTVRLSDPANPRSREPENMPGVGGGAQVQLPLGGGFHAGAGVRYTGSQFCQHPDTGADVRLAGGSWARADVSRSWDVGGTGWGPFSRMETRLAADNLGDRVLYDQCGLPRPGRVLSVQLRLF